MGVTLQKIFRGGFKAYSHKTGLSIDQHKAARAIMDCQSESLGYETYQCLDDENHLEKINHSCKHRSCPRCNHGLINDWLEKTKSRLLDCNHFHVVFTLPHELMSCIQSGITTVSGAQTGSIKHQQRRYNNF